MKKTISSLILSLMAFCASAQDLYLGSFYVTTPDEEALYGDGGDKWATRRTPICDMFNFEQPDVLGLQSYTSTQLSDLIRRMTNYKAAGDILYNKNTLTLDSCNVVEDMPEGSTCSWARLQKDGTAFYVFNICFPTDNNTAISSVTKIRSAIADVNTESLPCFIVGFLGVNESSTAYSRLNTRYPDCYTKASVVSTEFGTVNNFDLEANHGTERFDFIFVPRTKITVKAYGQLQYGYYTKDSDGNYKRRLLSAHFPVMAKVTLP